MKSASSVEEQIKLFGELTKAAKDNVYGIVDKFSNEGLTLKSYLPACVKQPPLFALSPDTIAEHIDILRLIHYNNEEEIDTEEFFNKILKKPIELSFSSKLLLIKYLIIPKMFENHPIPKGLKGNRLEKKLIEYIKNNPDKQYQINIKNIKAESDVINVLNNTLDYISEQAKTKSVFNLNVDET